MVPRRLRHDGGAVLASWRGARYLTEAGVAAASWRGAHYLTEAGVAAASWRGVAPGGAGSN